MKFKLVLVIKFLLGTQLIIGQITGRILDDLGNEPLEYATAALFNQKDRTLVTGVVSDSNGVFKMHNVKSGFYYLEVSFVGYETKMISDIEIKKGQKQYDFGDIKLVLGNQLNEIEIKTERSVVINKIDRQVFDSKSFQASQGGSASDVIKNLPSVTIDGLGDISVRGSKGFAVLINGRPVQGDAQSVLEQLPANAIERVEVITAPSAKFDPEGKGGIINVVTKRGGSNGVFTQLSIRGGFPSIEPYDAQEVAKRYGIDATVNNKTDKWNLSFGASYQRNDRSGRRIGELWIINEVEDKQTFLPSDGERSFDDINYNGRFTIDFTPNNTDEFSMGFFAGKHTKDRLADITYYDNHAVSPIGTENRLYTFSYYNHNLRTRKGDFVLGSFDYAHTFDNASNLSTSLLYEYTFLGGPTFNDNVDTPAYNVVYQSEFNTNDNPLHGFRFNLDYKLKPFSFGTLESGYQYRDLDHKGDFVYERDGVQVPEFSSNIELKRTIHSGYAQLFGNSGQWDYSAGLRLESMVRNYTESLASVQTPNVYEYDFLKLFPSASLQYKVNDNTKLKAAYSKRVERTTTFMMNSFVEREHSEVFEQGDNQLLPEFIDLVEMGINKKFDNKNSLYATAYYRHVDNVINRVNTLTYESNGAVIDSVLNRVYSNVGKSRSYGLEVGAQFKATEKWSNFIGANIYNYDIHGKFVFRHRDGITRTYAVKTNSTIFSFNVNSTYSFWKDATAQFTLNYLSDTNTAQGEDSRFYSPNLTIRKSFLDNRLMVSLQWQNIDMGLLNSNEQSIATWRLGEFYTYTNYVYEVDMVTLNLTYTFNKVKNKSKFIESEFGKREF